MEKLIDIGRGPVSSFLDLLLADKATKKNIIWATDTYESLGHGFTDKEQMDQTLLLQHAELIKPRIQKTQETQAERTRKKAEVFTPAWLCNTMNNYCDEEWFGKKNVFNIENDDCTWTVIEEPIEFPKRKTWKHYVDSRRLEITCGEAPYLVSRYDVSTGELIYPLKKRIGQLDRKLRIVNENALDYNEWVKWTIRAFEASYGYEYQGDNLLIARVNLLLTFIEYYTDRWGYEPDIKLIHLIANKIAWNIWQMDGRQDTVPLGKPYEKYHQLTMLETTPDTECEGKKKDVPCRVFNWRSKFSLEFQEIKGDLIMSNKLFNYVIGNPPYQEEQDSDDVAGSKKNYAPPVYNIFMDAANDVAERTELIHPARFLFNAGSTPKRWNEKMLKDEHFKVVKFEPDSNKVFPGLTTPIKGGIAITYHDDKKIFGAIGAFNQYKEVNEVAQKVIHRKDFQSIMDIVYSRTSYRLTEKMHQDYPDAIKKLSKGHAYDMSSNIFERLPNIFFDQMPQDEIAYIKVLGRLANKRVYKYIRKDYVNDVDNLAYYKVLVPQANGNGTFGESISQLVIAEPNVGNTETFISIGKFNSKIEAENAGKYISTKFARTLLSILKVTQNGNKPVWKMIPLQDFTSNSDIDWSKSVHEIDLQLYQKYGLSEDEIDFIETHVKEME
ncbi:Eco57I restriction-modification methylase domain-containing protein [Anaerovoracaceae bacterium SGI.174]